MLFRDIIGQEDIKKRLIRSVAEGRISHAQLFLGPEGSGTLPLAVAYARYICCTNRQPEDACGSCPSCNKYHKLIHPDLHWVYPIALSKQVRTSANVLPQWREAFAGQPYLNLFQWIELLDAENKQPVIGTDESIDILRRLSLTTYESEYKIMVIWMAEKMNDTAANKILKILEEPPDKTLFLMVCENEDQLLKTITSRTQLIKIKKLSDEVIQRALIDKNGLGTVEAMRIAHLADGSYNQALALLQQHEQADFNFQKFQELMRACFKLNVPVVLKWVDEMATIGRERQKNFLAYSLHMIRECLMVNYGAEPLVKLEGEELAFTKKFAPYINGANVERITEELTKASAHIERNASPKILFLDLAFKLNELLNVPVLSK